MITDTLTDKPTTTYAEHGENGSAEMAGYIKWSARPTDAAINDLAAKAFVLDRHCSRPGEPQLLSVDMRGAASSRGVVINALRSADRRITKEVIFGLRNTEQYAEFRAALSSDSGSQGGFARHEGFIDSLEAALYSANPIRRLASVFRQSGKAVRRPGVDVSTIEAGIVGRDALKSTPTFHQLVLDKDAYVAQWVVPMELDQDMAPNTANELAAALGTIIGNRQTREYTSGNGGLCGSAYPVTSAGAIVTGDDLENLIGAAAHYADPQRAYFMMNPTTWKVLRKAKDGSGRYLWRDNRLADFRVALNTAMPDVAVGASPVLFGDFRSFSICDTDEVRIKFLEETLIEHGQVIWHAEQESAGGLLDCGSHPIARLLMSA